jgi:tripartite-type tricarboxylate transporter receptor subunit TctC
MTGVNMLHIPYKGAAPATLAVLTGEVDATLGDIGVVEPHIQTGKLKAIAVTGEHRAPTLPKVATFAESGLPGYSSQTWIGLWVRAGLPDDRLQRLNQLFNQALQRPEIKALLAKQGMQARPSTVAEFTAFARKESDKYKTAIDKAHIHIN